MINNILVTGSSGLIGSEVVSYFSKLGFTVHGIDNNQREIFFGNQASTRWNQQRLCTEFRSFTHHELDIRERTKILDLIKNIKPSAIVHTAAQPSHDKAADIPFEDFEVNANGTLNLLQACRLYCPESPFIHLSTNKVYGDNPNKIKLRETDTRWDFDDKTYINGISEDFPIDQCMHSLFGASKLAADILVQEYGRYFNMPTCVLRGGCLTGPSHSGVELHGFLSYLVKATLNNLSYTIYGYKGKQVRDNIHAFDVATFIDLFIQNPKIAKVYNIGGGKSNSVSMLEAISMVQDLTGKTLNTTYDSTNRTGDHIVYYSDLTRIKEDYPSWSLTRTIPDMILEIANSWSTRL